jgi:hypothetical protein
MLAMKSSKASSPKGEAGERRRTTGEKETRSLIDVPVTSIWKV